MVKSSLMTRIGKLIVRNSGDEGEGEFGVRESGVGGVAGVGDEGVGVVGGVAAGAGAGTTKSLTVAVRVRPG